MIKNLYIYLTSFQLFLLVLFSLFASGLLWFCLKQVAESFHWDSLVKIVRLYLSFAYRIKNWLDLSILFRNLFRKLLVRKSFSVCLDLFKDISSGAFQAIVQSFNSCSPLWTVFNKNFMLIFYNEFK